MGGVGTANKCPQRWAPAPASRFRPWTATGGRCDRRGTRLAGTPEPSEIHPPLDSLLHRGGKIAGFAYERFPLFVVQPHPNSLGCAVMLENGRPLVWRRGI